MRCLYCDKRLWFGALGRRQFCSDLHQAWYEDEQSGLAIRRVMDPLGRGPGDNPLGLVSPQPAPPLVHASPLADAAPALEPEPPADPFLEPPPADMMFDGGPGEPRSSPEAPLSITRPLELVPQIALPASHEISWLASSPLEGTRLAEGLPSYHLGLGARAFEAIAERFLPEPPAAGRAAGTLEAIPPSHEAPIASNSTEPMLDGTGDTQIRVYVRVLHGPGFLSGNLLAAGPCSVELFPVLPAELTGEASGPSGQSFPEICNTPTFLGPSSLAFGATPERLVLEPPPAGLALEHLETIPSSQQPSVPNSLDPILGVAEEMATWVHGPSSPTLCRLAEWNLTAIALPEGSLPQKTPAKARALPVEPRFKPAPVLSATVLTPAKLASSMTVGFPTPQTSRANRIPAHGGRSIATGVCWAPQQIPAPHSAAPAQPLVEFPTATEQEMRRVSGHVAPPRAQICRPPAKHCLEWRPAPGPEDDVPQPGTILISPFYFEAQMLGNRAHSVTEIHGPRKVSTAPVVYCRASSEKTEWNVLPPPNVFLAASHLVVRATQPAASEVFGIRRAGPESRWDSVAMPLPMFSEPSLIRLGAPLREPRPFVS